MFRISCVLVLPSYGGQITFWITKIGQHSLSGNPSSHGLVK